MASPPFCLFPFFPPRPQHSQPFARAVNFARSASSQSKSRRLLPTRSLTRHRSPRRGRFSTGGVANSAALCRTHSLVWSRQRPWILLL